MGRKESVHIQVPYPSGFGELFKGPGAKTLAIKGGYMMKERVCATIGVSLEAVNNIQNNLISQTGSKNP